MKVYGRRSVIEAIKSDLEIQKAFIKKNAINMEEIIIKKDDDNSNESIRLVTDYLENYKYDYISDLRSQIIIDDKKIKNTDCKENMEICSF